MIARSQNTAMCRVRADRLHRIGDFRTDLQSLSLHDIRVKVSCMLKTAHSGKVLNRRE